MGHAPEMNCPDCGYLGDHHVSNSWPIDHGYRIREKTCNHCFNEKFITIELPYDDYVTLKNEVADLRAELE